MVTVVVNRQEASCKYKEKEGWVVEDMVTVVVNRQEALQYVSTKKEGWVVEDMVTVVVNRQETSCRYRDGWSKTW